MMLMIGGFLTNPWFYIDGFGWGADVAATNVAQVPGVLLQHQVHGDEIIFIFLLQRFQIPSCLEKQYTVVSPWMAQLAIQVAIWKKVPW